MIRMSDSKTLQPHGRRHWAAEKFKENKIEYKQYNYYNVVDRAK